MIYMKKIKLDNFELKVIINLLNEMKNRERKVKYL